jgi:hypothetical protein
MCLEARSPPSILFTCFIAFGTGKAVNDAAFVHIMADDQVGDFLQCGISGAFHGAFVDQIRAIERLDEYFASIKGDSHLLKNIFLYTGRGGGRQ